MHTYAGYVYDYYSSSFGRQGLDDRNLRLRLIANPARPETQSLLISQYPTFFNTAQYRGNGLMVFGAGTVTNGIVTVGPRGGALDIVAHEYTHGVTQFSSKLISQNESGALNESFSDIMGGAVHTNASISNHAFYLAIMGGTNRVSGLSVEGVGFSNRKQIERAFYRAYTQILTASATFSNARAACIQAARDLFGIGSAPERAVTQANDGFPLAPRTLKRLDVITEGIKTRSGVSVEPMQLAGCSRRRLSNSAKRQSPSWP